MTGAERGFLFLYNQKGRELTLKVKRSTEKDLQDQEFSFENHRVSLDVIKEVEKTRDAIIANKDSANQFPELASYNIRETLCVALQSKDKMLGVIYLDNSFAEGMFGPEELELMNSFAVQASVSIENAYLVSNLVEQERLKQEMELGRQIQMSLLPQKMPHVKMLRVGGAMEPAKEIGGDYYDFIVIRGEQDKKDDDTGAEKLGIVIADVSGKGVDAGMVMGMTKAFIQSLAEQELSPRDLVLKLNKHLFGQLNHQKFVSLIYAEYLAKKEMLTWSGAGHEHLILCKKNGVELIKAGGIVLGVFDDIDHIITQDSVKLAKGDRIVLYCFALKMFFVL